MYKPNIKLKASYIVHTKISVCMNLYVSNINESLNNIVQYSSGNMPRCSASRFSSLKRKKRSFYNKY